MAPFQKMPPLVASILNDLVVGRYPQIADTFLNDCCVRFGPAVFTWNSGYSSRSVRDRNRR